MTGCRTRASAAVAALVALAGAAAAEPLAADRLPPQLLAECDAGAAPVGRADPAIAAAVAALTELGAFSPQEFDGVRIGFCPLRREGGPVGATSCRDAIVLLDDHYLSADDSLTLRVTLAHETLHVLQHRARKARHGEAYCDSARYVADKPSLENTADRFGDAAASAFALGRQIEVVNDCAAPALVYLEADDAVGVRGREASFLRVPARGSAIASERALSRGLRFYARTEPATGPAHVWENRRGAETRFVEGRLARLKSAQLAAPDRLKSPFRLRLGCNIGSVQ